MHLVSSLAYVFAFLFHNTTKQVLLSSPFYRLKDKTKQTNRLRGLPSIIFKKISLTGSRPRFVSRTFDLSTVILRMCSCISSLPHHATGRVTRESPPQTVIVIIIIIIMANILNTFMPSTVSSILEGIIHLIPAISTRCRQY